MRSDAGWRKEDGLRDDMWRHQAWQRKHFHKPEPETCTMCAYGLEVTSFKESTAWDAQYITVYACHLGKRTGQLGMSNREMCEEGQLQLWFPQAASAKAARTGGLESAGT